jgi:hypothetical protein
MTFIHAVECTNSPFLFIAWIMFHFVHVPMVYPFTYWKTFELFAGTSDYKTAAIDIYIEVFMFMQVFISLGKPSVW